MYIFFKSCYSWRGHTMLKSTLWYFSKHFHHFHTSPFLAGLHGPAILKIQLYRFTLLSPHYDSSWQYLGSKMFAWGPASELITHTSYMHNEDWLFHAEDVTANQITITEPGTIHTTSLFLHRFPLPTSVIWGTSPGLLVQTEGSRTLKHYLGLMFVCISYLSSKLLTQLVAHTIGFHRHNY